MFSKLRSNLLVIAFSLLASAFIATGRTVEPFACSLEDGEAAGRLPFCQPNLPLEDRARDLIRRLTLEEKVSLLGNDAAGIPRLGIKRYEWWSEALHGVSNVGPGTRFGGSFPSATIFPQVITTASSFNSTLWEAIGQVVSDEARAIYNGGLGGLTFWSPNVNIFRDPRWGRGQETPGEDPYVVGTYAASYVRGLQGTDPNRLKVAACCKHFTAYDLDNWKGTNRFRFNAKVSKQDMEDTFNVPFKMCVKEGNVASVMCSYNQVNGVPTCADPNLLKKTVRAEWNLNGYVVSDCDSVGVYFDTQHYTSTPEEAAADAIKAGLDLDCGPFLGLHAEEAVRHGLLTVADIDGALFNTLLVQMRLGMFNGDPSGQVYGGLGPKDVCTSSHKDLALEAARQGIVLLKNDNHNLPLSSRHLRKVAVIGPNADVTETMIGNYAGVACGYTTPLQGVGTYVKTIHEPGCEDVACGSDRLFGAAIAAAGKADASILFMGLDQSIEAEFKDRDGLLLPGKQQELISKIVTASKGPTVLVIMSGGPLDVSLARDDPKVAAVLWAGYPGQAGGAAIADILFGTANPGGRLPMTWYPQGYVTSLAMTNMDMRSRATTSYPGRTYRFYNGPVVYPFGYGLSYSEFSHEITNAPTTLTVYLSGHRRRQLNTTDSDKAIKVTHARCRGLSIRVDVHVRNIGSRDGSNTLLVYASPPGSHGSPIKQLVGFQKIQLTAGGEKMVEFNIHVCKFLSIVDGLGIRRIPLGVHRLLIGDVEHSVSLEPEIL